MIVADLFFMSHVCLVLAMTFDVQNNYPSHSQIYHSFSVSFNYVIESLSRSYTQFNS